MSILTSRENLTDISEPQVPLIEHISINSIFHLCIQVSMVEKQFLPLN